MPGSFFSQVSLDDVDAHGDADDDEHDEDDDDAHDDDNAADDYECL